MQHPELILVLDFGSQYSQLIARRVRELGVYAELHPFNFSIQKIKGLKPKGIILSGGPSSVYDRGAPHSSPELLELGIPVLGICYGLQMIAYQLGGEVDRSAKREFGRAEVVIDDNADLFAGFDGQTAVWMSHGDALTELPNGFERIGHSANSPICAIRNREKKIYGVQFHPEVVHTERGKEILRNFLFGICECKGGWNAGSFIEAASAEIRTTVGKDNVICALSGGVDSSVLAVLLNKAIGDQLYCIHIDTGLMRKGESEKVVKMFRDVYHVKLEHLDASKNFMKKLKGVADPEQKRKIIGATFIELFEQEANKIGSPDGRAGKARFLAQGTLYPDVIESTSFRGPSAKIKTHHNVGGLPKKMKFRLIEPFRELFKDEVRAVGRKLGLPEEFIVRHPFPGPGLAVRIPGEITEPKLAILREADDIFVGELRRAGLYESVWQAFAVLLPVQSVGVMGDGRTYENVVALRAVTSLDGMTADWARLPYDLLVKVSGRVINEIRGVNRVVYDISSKPPATIEWE